MQKLDCKLYRPHLLILQRVLAKIEMSKVLLSLQIVIPFCKDQQSISSIE